MKPHPAVNASRIRRGFTMIEMLTVVAIILILASLLLPHVIKFVKTAKNRVAEAESRAIVNALKSYRTVYRRWPGQTSGDADRTFGDPDSFTPELQDHALIIAALTNNPRNTVFIELKPEMLSDDGFTFIDPWGAPYYITMDENEDGALSIETPEGNFEVRGENVGVISEASDPANTNKWILSWIQ